MPTTANVINLAELYKEHFSKNPYHINSSGKVEPITELPYSGLRPNPRPKGTIHQSEINGLDFNKIGAYGQDIWHSIFFESKINYGKVVENIKVEIDTCTVSVQLTKTIIRTPVVERKGSVIEICDIENPRFTIRGFLIGKNRTVPERDIDNLRKLFEANGLVTLNGAYVELFLAKTCRVVITDLEFPEVQGKAHWFRPFTLQCEADFIDDLIEIPG